MKKSQSKTHNILSIRAIIDDAKCFQTVRELRWPDGVCCPHCDSRSVVKYGRDETQPERQRYHSRSCDRYLDDLTERFSKGIISH